MTEQLQNYFVPLWLISWAGQWFFLRVTKHLPEHLGELAGFCIRNKIRLVSQADGLSRGQMLEEFCGSPQAVLLGTDTFWQGIDLPGELLTQVIIPRLPFAVPDRPLIAAPYRGYQTGRRKCLYGISVT